MLAARRTAGTVGAPGGMAEDSGDARWIKADWRVHVQGRTARRPHIDMADDENTEVEEQPKQVEESGGVLDLNSALQQVLKKAAVQPEGLARGLREAVKALDRKVVRAPTLPCVKIERPSVRARLVAGGRQDQQIAGLFCAGCSGGGGGRTVVVGFFEQNLLGSLGAACMDRVPLWGPSRVCCWCGSLRLSRISLGQHDERSWLSLWRGPEQRVGWSTGFVGSEEPAKYRQNEPRASGGSCCSRRAHAYWAACCCSAWGVGADSCAGSFADSAW